MSLSPEFQLLKDNEATYSADPEIIGTELSEKTLVMVGGPTMVGKTSLITRAVEILPSATAVPSIVDRKRKPGDPLEYQTASEGVTFYGLKSAINKNMLVNYAVHPAENIYATDLQGYSEEYNFLPTMMNEVGIEQLRRAGFKRETIAYILMSGNAYKQNVGKENFGGKRKARMEEAIVSLEYAKAHADEINFIRNRLQPGGLEKAAQKLALVAYGIEADHDKTRAVELIDEMIDAAKKLAK